MAHEPARTLQIAAALMDDGQGRLLLVRKRGTKWFMQAGGKIRTGENAWTALRRELHEEIGLDLPETVVPYLGCFSAAAANEPDCVVAAELYHVRSSHSPSAGAEIEQAVWIELALAERLELAPLTRKHVLPLARKLGKLKPKAAD